MSNVNLIRPNDLVKKHSHYKLGTMRSWIFNANQNGLKESGALTRVGRSIYIDEDKLLEWVLSQNVKLIRPNDLVKKHSHYKLGTLRSWILNANQNGLKESGALTRVGRSIYIDEDKLLEWVLSQNG